MVRCEAEGEGDRGNVKKGQEGREVTGRGKDEMGLEGRRDGSEKEAKINR